MDTIDYSTYTNEQLLSVIADELSKAPIDQSTFLKSTSTTDLQAIADGVEGAREAAEQKYRENTFRMHTEGFQFTGDDDRDFEMFRFAEAHGMFDTDVSAGDVVKGFGRGLVNMAKGGGSFLGSVYNDFSSGMRAGSPLTASKYDTSNEVAPTVAVGVVNNFNDFRMAWEGAKYILEDNDDVEAVRRAKFEFIKNAQKIEEDNKAWYEKVVGATGYAPDPLAAEFIGEIADPTNLIGGGIATKIAKGAAKTALGKSVMKRTQAALTGNVRRLSKEAIDAEAKVVAASAKLATTRKVLSDGKAIETARKTLADAKNARTVANDALSAAMSNAPVGIARRAASGTIKTAGRVVEGTGKLLNKTRVAVFGGDEMAEGIATAASGGAAGVLRSANIITKAGRDTRIFGETLAAGRATVPYFRRLAANPDLMKPSRFAAKLIDKSQTAWLGSKVIEGGKVVAPAFGISGSFGYLASGGDLEAAAESAGAGAAFGISGGAYGAWQAYQTQGARVEELQANRNVYLQSLSSRPDGSGRSQREMFERLQPHEQLMIGTFAQAHPDLAWRFDPTLKPEVSGKYDRDTNEITINPNSKDPIKDIFAHEVAHGIETHGVGAHARTLLVGNAETGQAGEYTQLDDAGAPVVREDGTLETTDEFKSLKQTYADLLEVDVNTISDTYMASELFAEHYADRLIGGGIIRDLRQSPVDRTVDALGNSSIVKGLMGHLGLTFNQADRVVGSGVFKDLRRSRAVDRLAKDWNKDRSFGKLLPEREEVDTVLGEKELRDKKLAKKWAGAGGFIQVDASGNPVYKSDGTPVYITPKQAEAQQQLLGRELQVALDEYLAENPDTDAVRLQADANGNQIYVGNHLPDEVVERIEASGQFNPTQIATLKAATATVKQNGLGAMILHFYQAASRKGRKGYKSVSGRWRRDAVYGFRLTKGGNIVLNTVSWERLFDNVRKAAKTKGAKNIWGPDSLNAINTDVETYLENISNGRPGAEGLGNDKRDFINNLFGYRTKGSDVNPWHDKTKAPVPFFTSLRLDRMNRLETLDTAQWKWGPDQNRDVKLNRRPETPTPTDSVVNPAAREIASKYYENKFGEPLSPHSEYEKLPVPQLQELADFLEEQEHSPNDPAVQRSYNALSQETLDQYQAMLDAGVTIEPYEGDGEPYANSKEMVKDVTENNHLWFFMTDNGFGSGDQVADHPLMEKSGIMIGDRELLFNDLFRAVHDYFGHTQKGFQFGPRGEFNAWREHSPMFSPEAQGALAAETLAQNAWVNNGKHIRREDGTVPKKGEEGYVHPADRPFADQKAFIVPDEMIAQFRPETQEAGTPEVPEPGLMDDVKASETPPVIMLSGFGTKSATDASKQAVSLIEALGTPNPLSDREVLIDTVSVEVSAGRQGRVRINSIQSTAKGRGDATRVLKQILDIADRKGVEVELSPEPFGEGRGRLSKEDLVDWYSRHGFKPQGENMVREPSIDESSDQYRPESPEFKNRPETVDTIKAKVTKNGKLAFPVKGRKPLELVHYSKTANIEEIDPTKMKAKANVYSRMYRGINKSFFYTDGTKPHASENVNESFPYRYKAQIDPSKLYDFSKDEADLWFSPNPEVMEQGLKDAGYQGFYAETDDGRKFVALFHKMPVDGTEVIESDPIEGNVDGVEDFEEETEADRRYASWQRNKPKPFSPNRPETNSEFTTFPDDSKITEALSSDKEPFVGAHRDLEPGTPVGLRIDIPAFLRTGTYVVTIHEKAGSRVGKRIGYDGIAAVSDPTFFSNERGAEKIRDGNAKFPIATVEGRFDPSREIPADINDWTAVGYNPKDHSYFYDKETDQPVVSGSQAVSVGNTVFVKDPVYGNVEDFAFRPETKAAPEDFTKEKIGDILEKTDWAIMTAENAGGVSQTADENSAQNLAMIEDLSASGRTPTKIIGQYGNLENSFLITDISESEALELGKKYDQESVLTRRGFIHQDGSVDPAVGVTVHNERPEDFFSIMPDGTMFSVDIVFDSRTQNRPEMKASVAQYSGSAPADGPNIAAEEASDLPLRVSTRVPRSQKATDDAIEHQLAITTEDVLADAGKTKTVASRIRGYVNTPKSSSKSPNKAVEQFKAQVVENLLWLHDTFDPVLRERAKLWYDGARKLTEEWSGKYELPRESVAGVMASLSPQKDWFMNVDLARRVIEHQKTLADRELTEGMVDWFRGRFGSKKPDLLKSLEMNVGRKISELGLTERAVVLRAYDEITTDRGYQIVTPEGDFAGPATKKDGTPGRVAWGDFGVIAKSLSIIEDPSRANISANLGGEHKVRNFFNNILLPNNPEHGDVTIDTHAVAAGLIRPLAGGDTEVGHNLGGTGAVSSALTGASGFYGIYADAYREAAEQRGRLPREMQSITWEAVRGLFPASFKTKRNKAAVDAVWNSYKNGELSINEVRTKIHDLAGGIDIPSWAGPDS